MKCLFGSWSSLRFMSFQTTAYIAMCEIQLNHLDYGELVSSVCTSHMVRSDHAFVGIGLRHTVNLLGCRSRGRLDRGMNMNIRTETFRLYPLSRFSALSDLLAALAAAARLLLDDRKLFKFSLAPLNFRVSPTPPPPPSPLRFVSVCEPSELAGRASPMRWSAQSHRRLGACSERCVCPLDDVKSL